MTTRAAAHAGSWYTRDARRLTSELESWLAAVPENVKAIGTKSSQKQSVAFPHSGARAIIAPHAGYSYSGPAAAWAYKAIDWKHAKRVFLLGPSHHYYLSSCALSRCHKYSTPMGDLELDLGIISELRKTGKFEEMSQAKDEAEHSLEMHLPYIFHMLSKAFPSAQDKPLLVPILVGATSASIEAQFGRLLAPYLADPTNVFVVSSDFCHWGQRFRYTYYQPSNRDAVHLRASDRTPNAPKIHESIAKVDMQSMDAIETGRHCEFLQELEKTGNTVCGRHPIGVVMAAIEELGKENGLGEEIGLFQFVKYDRSELIDNPRDSSVSYCSAFAVF